MNSRTLTLKINANTVKPAPKYITAAQIGRTLARKWDMIAVIGLMSSSALYGIYALTQMTGF